MKLVQNKSDKPLRYEGVLFPRGVAVELPPDYQPHWIDNLKNWGWTEVADDPAPAPVESPMTEEIRNDAAIDGEEPPARDVAEDGHDTLDQKPKRPYTRRRF